ncbi:MAG: TIGR03619 family F420-dependent LLM class oxidoreductase [Dehalococcoidia bacterium]
MKIGITVRPFYGFGGAEGGVHACLEIGRRAEQLGYDSVWLTDHVVLPEHIEARYPYNEAGQFMYSWRDDVYEPLVLMSALAQLTERVEIGVAVLVIPYRHPLMTAKMLSTADRLSNGRIILGAGAGWLQDEFEALGLPADHFEHRGSVTNDYIRAMKEAWGNTGPSRYAGKYVNFTDVGTFPHPVRTPHIPIWAGGKGRQAMLRAVRLCDGYLAIAADPVALRHEIDELQRLSERDRRDPGELTIALMGNIMLTAGPAPADRQPLTGNPEQILEDLRRYEEAGLGHLVAGVRTDRGPTLEATLAAMEVIAHEVLPAVREGGTI